MKMRLDGAEWRKLGSDLRGAAAAKLPNAQREAFTAIGSKALSLVNERYRSTTLPWLRRPAHYQDQFGEGLRVTKAVGPKLSYLTISDIAEDAAVVEGGRAPGGKPPFDVIAEWASEKFGIEDDEVPSKRDPGKSVAGPGRRTIEAIRTQIARQGSTAHQIFYFALASGTPGGAQLDSEIARQMDIVLDKLLGGGK